MVSEGRDPVFVSTLLASQSLPSWFCIFGSGVKLWIETEHEVGGIETEHEVGGCRALANGIQVNY
jgi:hypothetical protein